MNWLKRVRNSAYFLDAMLAIAVIMAILGLVVFARMHSSRLPAKVSQTNKIVGDFAKADLLQTAEDNSTAPPSNTGSQVKGDSTTSPSAPTPSSTAPNNTPTTENTTPTVTPVCDATKKTQLLNDYRVSLSQENERYIRAKSGVVGTLTNDILARLLSEHNQILTNLESTLNTNLKAINCTL